MTSRRLLMVGGVLVLGGAALLVFGLVDRTEDPSRQTSPVRTPAASTRSAVSASPRGFGEVAVRITDRSGRAHKRCLLAARTEAQQARGLMEVRDASLDGHDGMVFLFAQAERTGFWMRNTPMPLSIAYFDRSGRVVSMTDMTPCADSPNCRSYAPAGPYTSAIEVPRGRLADLGIGRGARLAVGGSCP